MALLWILEPIPIYITALLPLVIFPLFSVDTFATVAANYSNKNISADPFNKKGYSLKIEMKKSRLKEHIKKE